MCGRAFSETDGRSEALLGQSGEIREVADQEVRAERRMLPLVFAAALDHLLGAVDADRPIAE